MFVSLFCPDNVINDGQDDFVYNDRPLFYCCHRMTGLIQRLSRQFVLQDSSGGWRRNENRVCKVLESRV